PHLLMPRPLSLAVLAAFLTFGLWLFVPWGRLQSSFSTSGGSDDHAVAAPSLKTDGPPQIDSHDNVITRLVLPISVSGSDSVRLPNQDGTLRAETSLSESAAAAVPGTFAVNRLDGNGDDLLDPGEHAELIVDLPARSSIHPGNPLRLVVTTADGALLPVEHVID